MWTGRAWKRLVDNAHRLLPRLRRALLEGSYRPGDIRTMYWIPRSRRRSARALGIPNVIATGGFNKPELLAKCSNPGLRTGLSTRAVTDSVLTEVLHTAIAEAKTYLEDGRSWLVDA